MRILILIMVISLILGNSFAEEFHKLSNQEEKFVTAIQTNDYPKIQEMIKTSPQLVNMKYVDNFPIVFYIVQIGNLKLLTLFAEHGADLKVKCDNDLKSYYSGSTLLLMATKEEKLDIIKYLVEKGLPVNDASTYGITPLHAACGFGSNRNRGNKIIVEYLLNHGANANAKMKLLPGIMDLSSSTSLISACNAKHINMDEFGTPLMIAIDRPEIQTLLITHGAKPLSADMTELYNILLKKDRVKTCISNLRQITASIQMYAQDHEETLPVSTTVWSKINVDPTVLLCPESKNKIGYGYNINLSGKNLGTVVNPTIIVIAADSEKTLISSMDDIDTIRHGKGFCAAFCDGHVGFFNIDDKIRFK